MRLTCTKEPSDHRDNFRAMRTVIEDVHVHENGSVQYSTGNRVETLTGWLCDICNSPAVFSHDLTPVLELAHATRDGK